MDTPQIIVTITGALLIGLILWFFFGARQATAAKRIEGGVQEVEIVVRGTYTPNRIEVEAGRPVRLTFIRRESNPCTAQVVFPDFGIVRDLPEGKPVPIEFTPQELGEFDFHCSMNMVRGRLVVRTGIARTGSLEPLPAATSA